MEETSTSGGKRSSDSACLSEMVCEVWKRGREVLRR